MANEECMNCSVGNTLEKKLEFILHGSVRMFIFSSLNRGHFTCGCEY